MVKKKFPFVYCTIIALFCCLFFSAGVYAQKNTITTGVYTNILEQSKNKKMFEIAADFGYNFTDYFFMNLRFEDAIAHFTVDNEVKSYINDLYGVNLGYNFYRFSRHVLDARLGFGSDLTKKADWNYNYYFLEVNLNYGSEDIKPTFGIGVKFYDSRNDIFKDSMHIYISFGYKISFL